MKKKRSKAVDIASGAKARKAFEDLAGKLLKVPKKELPKDNEPKPKPT